MTRAMASSDVTPTGQRVSRALAGTGAGAGTGDEDEDDEEEEEEEEEPGAEDDEGPLVVLPAVRAASSSPVPRKPDACRLGTMIA